MTNDTTMNNKVRSNTMNNNIRSNTITGRHLWLPPKQGYYEWSASWSQVSTSQHYRDVTPTLLQWTVLCLWWHLETSLSDVNHAKITITPNLCSTCHLLYRCFICEFLQRRKLVYIEFNPLCICCNHICTQQIWSISLLI